MTQRIFTYNHLGCQPLVQWHPQDERQLQRFFEANLAALIDVTLVASEWSPTHDTLRFDTLGIDREGCPVIIEFKNVPDAYVITQLLAYKAALVGSQGNFLSACKARFGTIPYLNWDRVRLIAIAPSFSAHELVALQSINADMDFLTFRFFGPENVLLEAVGTTRKPRSAESSVGIRRSFSSQLDHVNPDLKKEYGRLMESLGELDDLYLAESTTGIYGTSAGCDIFKITITQGVNPRIRIHLNGMPPENLSSTIGYVSASAKGSIVTFREATQIAPLIEWIAAEIIGATISNLT